MGQVDRVWAPWRSQFLLQRPSRRCIFCTVKRLKADRQHHVIARVRHVFAVLNRYPYTNGHLLIAPYRHVGAFKHLTPLEWTEILTLSQHLIATLQRVLRAQGFNVGFNLGKVAGAGIPGHLHLHIVPRWNGDTNFMPVLTNTRVMSQSLDTLYQLLTKPPRASRRRHASR